MKQRIHLTAEVTGRVFKSGTGTQRAASEKTGLELLYICAGRG